MRPDEEYNESHIEPVPLDDRGLLPEMIMKETAAAIAERGTGDDLKAFMTVVVRYSHVQREGRPPEACIEVNPDVGGQPLYIAIGLLRALIDVGESYEMVTPGFADLLNEAALRLQAKALWYEEVGRYGGGATPESGSSA